jgi:hypothetical protein
MDDKHGDFRMPSTLRKVDDPHDAPIAPDIVPADWADCVPGKPASDAASREKLFAEIRNAAEAAAPKVDNTFRASDVNDIPALKSRARSRAWMKRALTVFVLALLSAFAAAVWKHHGAAATQTLVDLVPLPGVSASPAAEPAGEPAAQPAAEQQAAAPQPAEAPASTAALPPEAEQQIQSMARDLAAMGEQIEQLKATIETLKANQQAAAAAPPPPVARAPAPPPKPKVTALPSRAAPHPPRPAYSPAMQAAAVPPPPQAPAAAPPPAYQPPPYSPPPQATTQPNGEPIVRPPMPMPLSDRY